MYVDHEASQVGCAIEATPALLNKVPGIAKWPSRADSARPETIDYMRRNGFPQMRGAKKGKGSVEDGIEFIRGFDLVVHPRCVNLERELTLYSYQTDKQTGEILPKVKDANNHHIDALRYAVEGLHRKGKRLPENAKSEPKRRDYGRGARDDSAENWKVL
jgi:phage terminase large subunit